MELTARAITKNQYFLHKFDPRSLIIAGFLLTVPVVASDNLILLGIIVAVCFLMLLSDIKHVLVRLASVNFFMIFLWLTLPFTAENGVSQALTYTLRVNAAALIFMVTIAPMGVYTAGSAMMKLKLPHKLVAILLLSYRYIFSLWEHLSASVRAMNLRKPDKMGIMALWRTYASIIATTIAESINKSDRVQQAMLCRGFDGRFPITRDFHWYLRDTLFVTFVSALALLIYLVSI